MSGIVTVGLDMSLVATGVCILRGEEVELHTVRTTPKKYAHIYERIDAIVSACMAKVPEETKIVCIESPFVRVCGRTIDSASKNLVALSHMIRRAIVERGITFREVAPTQLKKFILGKGAGDKSMILREVYKRYSVDAADDNQADACVLANVAQAIHTFQTEEWATLMKYQAEVVQKIVG